MIGIYAIYNKANGKYYIGQSKYIQDRWIKHRSRLKCQTHENRHLQAAYNKYGAESFEFIIIEECKLEELNSTEQAYIMRYNSYVDGYNLDMGGNGCVGYKHTNEELSKMRQIQNPNAVLQIDKNLNVISRLDSASHAAKTIGTTHRFIESVCNRINHQKSAKGFIWVWEWEYLNDAVDWEYYTTNNAHKSHSVDVYDMEGNYIASYNSQGETARMLGIGSGEVNACLKGKRKSSHGYKFKLGN